MLRTVELLFNILFVLKSCYATLWNSWAVSILPVSMDSLFFVVTLFIFHFLLYVWSLIFAWMKSWEIFKFLFSCLFKSPLFWTLSTDHRIDQRNENNALFILFSFKCFRSCNMYVRSCYHNHLNHHRQEHMHPTAK